MKNLWIGQLLVDTKTNKLCKITNLTSNSVEVYLEKLTDMGINCTQYFSDISNGVTDFEKRFKVATLDDLFEISIKELDRKIDKIFEKYKSRQMYFTMFKLPL